MFTRVCKEETIAEGGMRVVIADAQVIILAWPENGVIKAQESALAEYPVKIEDGVVYIDTEGVSPLFAAP